MALQKTPIPLNFAQGLDTKTDPFQVSLGKFLSLQNSVFTTTNRLTKRNGFANITALPDKAQTTLTTLNDNLIATGSSLYAYSQDTDMWLNQGTVQPVNLNTKPLVRISTSQESPDASVAENGLSCLVYMDNGNSYYHIIDTNTGQQIVARTQLVATAVNPRVFRLGIYFIITYIATIAATPTIQYIAIPVAKPTDPKPAVTFSATVNTLNAGYDGFVGLDALYISWGSTAASISIKSISAFLVPSATVSVAGHTADLMSVTIDPRTNYIWASYWELSTTTIYTAAFNSILGSLVANTFVGTADVVEITSLAIAGVLSIYVQVEDNYSYTDNTGDLIRTDYVHNLNVTPPGAGTGPGTVISAHTVLTSVGLASKAFFGSYTYTLTSAPNVQITTKTLPNNFQISSFVSATRYMAVVYGDIEQINPLDNSNQSTYFLVNDDGDIYMRLAYANAGGYAQSQVLPTVSLVGTDHQLPYMFADFLATVNKTTNPPAGTPSNAIYTQYGINLASFSINNTNQQSSEIAGALHLTGGQLWEYDGVKPVEHGFHVWPENVVVTTSATGGLITAQTYNYVFTYEWTDNQGNLHRSAPSIPVSIVTTGTTSTNTINVPTNRLTYKIPPNPIRIVGYRWSTAQQTYYQFTSVTSPVLNNLNVNSVVITDTLSDDAILGTTLLYTTGGVIENIAAPPSIDSCLFNNRLFLIDAEDQNLLWYSKQVIQAVPVEMSDLLTLYVAPTTGSQGSTGPMKTITVMDDKLIIFKENAIYYINGSGPDNTGANNTFSDPVFITSAVGCANPNSVVLMPHGVMFQSDKGIWMLGRDLSTQYIGAPVEQYNSFLVSSAVSIPGTNQIRFTLENSITLMYDYFFNQWGTHTNTLAISSTLWQGVHTYLNSAGQIFKETAGMYTDGAEPVLIGLTTSWINIAGVQGFERFYFANLLGTYFSPFILNVSLAYNYNPSAIQSITVTPEGNPAPDWGDEAVWGSGGPWGGSEGNIFSARVFPSTQKCQSFQVTIQEVYDPTLGVAAGQGLSLSGLNLIVGMKKGYRTQRANRSFG